MRSFISAVLAFIFIAPGAPAQTKSAPPEFSADAISGMYSFLQQGEFVHVNLEADGRVTGFISRFGDTESDRGASLDHFFTKGQREGRRITFESRAVHGVWFAFEGTVERGAAKSPSEEGYYVMKGTLTKYSSDQNKKTSARSREVIFKSFPQEPLADPRKKD
jgi:hypothetical protein